MDGGNSSKELGKYYWPNAKKWWDMFYDIETQTGICIGFDEKSCYIDVKKNS